MLMPIIKASINYDAYYLHMQYCYSFRVDVNSSETTETIKTTEDIGRSPSNRPAR